MHGEAESSELAEERKGDSICGMGVDNVKVNETSSFIIGSWTLVIA
jgi:hypothetical protein